MNTHGPLTLLVSQESPAVESQPFHQTHQYCCGNNLNKKEWAFAFSPPTLNTHTHKNTHLISIQCLTCAVFSCILVVCECVCACGHAWASLCTVCDFCVPPNVWSIFVYAGGLRVHVLKQISKCECTENKRMFLWGVFGSVPIRVCARMCEGVVYWQTCCSHVPENEANQIAQTVYFQTLASGLLPHTHSNTSRQTFRSGN